MKNHASVYVRSISEMDMSSIGFVTPGSLVKNTWSWLGLMGEISSIYPGNVVSNICPGNSYIGNGGNILSYTGSSSTVGRVG